MSWAENSTGESLSAARTARVPTGPDGRVVRLPASMLRSRTFHSLVGVTARSIAVMLARISAKWFTAMVQRDLALGSTGLGGGAPSFGVAIRFRVSEKLNSVGLTRTRFTVGAVRRTSATRTLPKTIDHDTTRTSKRSNSTKVWAGSCSASRNFLIATRPVKRLMSMSSMLAARPVMAGICLSACHFTISGRLQTKATPSTRSTPRTISQRRSRRLIACARPRLDRRLVRGRLQERVDAREVAAAEPVGGREPVDLLGGGRHEQRHPEIAGRVHREPQVLAHEVGHEARLVVVAGGGVGHESRHRVHEAHHEGVAGGLGDHVGDHLRVHPEAFRDAEGLAHRHPAHPRDQVVAELDHFPTPTGPTWMTLAPIAESAGRASSKSPAAPPTMIASVPSVARGVPPETGASMNRTPRSCAAFATRCETAGSMVDISTH